MAPRIFIVEDEALIAMTLADQLQQLGYKVCGQAARGEQALRAIPEAQPDVVLVDIRLAGKLTGIELAKELRGQFGLAIVFVTAYSDMQTLNNVVEADALGFVVKPIQPLLLRAAIQMALRRHALERELREAWRLMEQQSEALRRSESRYRGIVDFASDAILSVNADQCISSFNASAEAMFGYTAEEVLGQPLDILLPLASRDRHRDMLRVFAAEPKDGRRMRGGRELAGRRKDGTEFPAEVVISKAAVEGCYIFTAIVRDVTERKLAQQELRHRERHLLEAQRFAHIGSWEWNIRDDLFHGSEELFRLIGLQTTRTAPEVFQFLLQIVHPEDRDRVARTTQRCLLEGSSMDLEFCIVHPDGTERDIHLRGKVQRDPEGRAVSMSGSTQDITNRRRSEQAIQRARDLLQTVIDSSPDWIYVKDHDHRFLLVNKALAREQNLDPADMIGRPDTDFFSRELCEGNSEKGIVGFHQDDRDALRGKLIHNTNTQVARPSGGLQVMDTFKVPLRDQNGNIYGVLGYSRDVTDQRAATEKLRELNEQLEARVVERTQELQVEKERAESSNRAKTEFLARVSHELRTPLSAMLGFSELLHGEPLTQEQRDYVLEVRRAGKHLLELIDELLDLSRVEGGRLSIVPETVHLHPLLCEAVQLVRPLLDKDGIKLFSDFPESTAVFVDRSRLRQVLVNLLSNAAKYNRPGGSVRITAHVSAEDRLRLDIADTGCGVPPDKLSKLFVPFERLGAERTTIPGSGIGLALSKKLVELMGGNIGIDSVCGQGSTFWIELPLASARSGHSAISSTALVSKKNKLCVLHIDDSPMIRNLLRAVFNRQPSLSLVSASTGREGLTLARELLPNLILLDLNLEDLDGYEVLRALKADASTQHIPIVAVSGDVHPSAIQRALDAGFLHYVTKPLKLDDLVPTVLRLASASPQAG